ncbi:AsmA family protein [Bartonella machadoae]|uniref:AsmA family protein n=1 Tax=Bartonella machadoae TaxID=2893471 RepID=UPI001F4D25C9|nr:AsmA family protein [Bartonella machadoae]UNE53937.1 AsmA family protein [Bartonella machadoae]
MDAMTIAKLSLLLFFIGIVLDVVLTIAVVALYTSFIKRWILYFKVTQQLNREMKKHTESL